MATTYSYKVCPICGVHYAVEESFDEYRLSNRCEANLGWYCPNGHSLTYRESTLDKVRRERDSLKQQAARLEQRIVEERNRANAYKGHATRITTRAKAGVCPCCNRTFKQLAAHMRSQHPQFTPLNEGDKPSVQ